MSEKSLLQDFAEATIAQKGTSAEIAELKGRLTQKAELEGKQLNDFWYRLTILDIKNPKSLREIAKFVADERALKGGNAGSEFEVPAAILEKYDLLAKNIINQATADQAKLASEQSKAVPVINPAGGEEKIINKDTLIRARAAMKSRETTIPGVEFRATAYNGDFRLQNRSRFDALKGKVEGDLNSKLTVFLADGGGNYQNALALQKAIKTTAPNSILSSGSSSAKGEPDGFVGELTLTALEKIAGINIDALSTSAGRNQGVNSSDKSNTKDPASSLLNQGAVASTPVPAKKEATLNNYQEDLKSVQKYLEAWKFAIEKADALSNESDRNSNAQLLNASLQSLGTAMATFNIKYIAGKDNAFAKQNSEYLKSINNEIALYLRGKGPVNNAHYRDPLFAKSLLIGILGKNTIAPKLLTREVLLARLNTETKTLIKTLIDAKMEHGRTFEQALGETLGNPTIKGAWDKVFSQGLETYEKDIVTAINKVDETKLSAQERVSLNQLRDMYGTTSWHDLKDSNQAKLALGANGLLAVGLGVVGAGLTATGIGAVVGVPVTMIGTAGVIGAGAIVGGVLTTSGLMVLERKIYSGKEFFTEGAINTGTFFIGGVAFNVLRGAAVVGKIGLAGSILAEGAVDYSLGVSTDQIRAHFQGIDISLAESLKNNLAWALIPLVTRGGGYILGKGREGLAGTATESLAEANIRQSLGDNKGAEKVLKKLDDDINAVRATEATSTVPKKGIVKSTLDFNFTDKEGFKGFMNNFLLMRPISTPAIGFIANAIRQPLIALRSLSNTWLNDSKTLAWSSGISPNMAILAHRGFDTLKTAIFGTNAPGRTNGLLTVFIMGFYAAQETQNNLRGSNVSDIEYGKTFFYEHMKNQFLDIPETVISWIWNTSKDLTVPKNRF